MKTYESIKDIDSVISILSQISVWEGLNSEEQQKLYRRLEIGTFKKAEYIFQKGDQPTHVYMVKSGQIDLFNFDQNVSVQKQTVRTGECFGVSALIAMQTHMVTAIATEDSEVMVLSRQALLDVRHEDIELFASLMINIAKDIAQKLKLTDDILLQRMRERKGGQTLKGPLPPGSVLP
jgi:CRP/FNR family transcriptional regulator, cyclic AMP receptor protein